MVEIPKYDKIPPVVRYHGNIEEAKRHRGEALHVLNRLRTQKSFQNLSQDVLRRKLSGGVKVTTRYVMNTPYIDIYAPLIKKEIEEEEEKLKACFIHLLTYDVGPEIDPYTEILKIHPVAFCLEAHEDENGDCYTELNKEGRKFANEGIGCVQNLSQCKYHYVANEGEDNEIIRKASLFHYTYIWSVGGRDEVLKVVNHKGVADFEIRIPIAVPPGGVADIAGVFSEDLTKLYISVFSMAGYVPLNERFLSYHIYSLEKIDGENSWELIKSGYTPKGMRYIDNLVTRDGNCGCWKEKVETLEEYTDPLIRSSCFGGGGSWQTSGKRLKLHYKTFSMCEGGFLNSDKMEAFHMSPYLKDYAVCKANDSYSYDDDGVPLSFYDWNCECSCARCGNPSYCNNMKSNAININQINGWSAMYDIYNGLEEYDPDWDRFWSGVYHYFTRSYNITQKCWPLPGCPKGDAKTYRYNGSGFQDLGHGYTTYVYKNVSTNEREENYEGNCGHDGSSPGWVGCGLCGSGSGSFLCRASEMVFECSEFVYEPGAYANVREKRILSPLVMTLQDEESIGNTFISYDEETDSLIRGIKYKALDGKWYWYIRAKIPIRDDEEPFSVIKDCEDKKIDQELKLLLSDERFSRLEAIIFVEDIKEK